MSILTVVLVVQVPQRKCLLPFPQHWTWMWVGQLLHARSWFHLTWCNLGHSLGWLVLEQGQKAPAAGHVSPVVMVVRSCWSCWASMMIGWFWAHCLWALVLTILVGDYWICGGSNRGAIAQRKQERLAVDMLIKLATPFTMIKSCRKSNCK